ncbi:Uncharacterised protein [Mycobacteroides abscessus]|nr:Uncharacterised protein [Mycobacteroides abscessus]
MCARSQISRSRKCESCGWMPMLSAYGIDMWSAARTHSAASYAPSESRSTRRA